MITVRFGVQIDDTGVGIGPILSLMGVPNGVAGSPTETELQLTMSTGALLTLRGDANMGGFLDISNLPLSVVNSQITDFNISTAGGSLIFSVSGLPGVSGSMLGSPADFYSILLGNESLVGENVRIFGSRFSDTLHGGASDNEIHGGSGNDHLFGMAGNDILSGDAGNDILNGNAGVDSASYALAKAAVNVNLALTGAQNTGGGGVDTLTSIEDLIGSRFNDTLTGNSGKNVLTGGPGNDRLDGGTGSDTASYESAAIAVKVSLALTTAQNTLGAGTDTLIRVENLTGSHFNDTLTGNSGGNVLTGGDGNDKLTGGAGSDTASYQNAEGPVTVSLLTTAAQNTGDAGVDTLRSIENLSGSRFDDFLFGNAGNNVLFGGDGDDVLAGGAGNDTLNGGAGSMDAADYSDAVEGIMVSLSVTTAQETGGAGTDTLKNVEKLIGGDFDDSLTGDSLDNVLTGGLGADTLDGGSGNDLLSGDAGNDTFLFSSLDGTDTLEDFMSGADGLAFAGAVFAELATLNQAVSDGHGFIGVGETPADGDDYLIYDSVSGALYYDASGAGSIEGEVVIVVQLSPETTLVAEDIVVT